MSDMPRGRPPLPPEERADAIIQVRCREDEKKIIVEAAEREGKTISRYMIDTILRTAKKSSKKSRRKT